MLNFILKILTTIIKFIIRLQSKDTKVVLNAVTYSNTDRNQTYYISNNNLLSQKDLLFNTYKLLMGTKSFIKFGEYKVIIVTAVIDGQEFNYHHNVLITNTTTFDEYYSKVKDIINTHYDEGYKMDSITELKVLVWNMDHLKNANIKITASTVSKRGIKNTKSSIRNFYTSALNQYLSMASTPSLQQEQYFSPLKRKPIMASSFATLDIETVTPLCGLKSNKQLPIAISLYLEEPSPLPINICTGAKGHVKETSKIFIINYKKLNNDYSNLDDLINKMWYDFFHYLTNNFQGTIFVHNLGAFDGYFIFKYLSVYSGKNPEDLKTIIDDKNKFIQISYKNSIDFKDSFRIFPVSLNELCKVFGVEGKTSEYNIQFNSLELFKDPILLKDFIEYSIRDSSSLYRALFRAQLIYISDHGVDITTIYSTSTLSLKIYRMNFMDDKINIPSLNGTTDTFIRLGYFGGATDYYKAVASNLKYYDVNSLYPYAMCKPMPFEIIKHYKDMSNIKLKDFFGFALAEIDCPINIIRPILPYKSQDKTIYPRGNWVGVYFSEELKTVESYGYKVTLLSGYEFSKIDLFSNFIKHFYSQKKTSTGANRFIAKMHLNQLYGYFGRRKDLIETVNIHNKDLELYLATRVVKSYINISDDIKTLLLHSNINHHDINLLNISLNLTISNQYRNVKTNVAIASAVTSYARIAMTPFKLLPGTVYTDTDSIFTTDVLDNKFIGKDLGLMKDELNGITIAEGIFLGIKQYGYWYPDNVNKKECSVFAGISRNSLSFDELKALLRGATLVKEIPLRFFKSLKNLDIVIKSTKITIKQNNDKKLINNHYIPINIFNLNSPLPAQATGDNRTSLIKLANKIHKYIKYIIKVKFFK